MAFIISKKLKNIKFLHIIILSFMISSCSHSIFDGDRAFQYLSQQVALGYRIPGSQASRDTSLLIEKILVDNGWSVDFQEFIFEGVVLRNIVASKNTLIPEIIIGTHYDTRQLSDQELDFINQQMPVLGANDGGSGTSVLLELSHHLDSNSKNIWLVFFDGEDQGRINEWPWSVGADYFAANLENFPEKVLIVDMVGDNELKIFKEKNSSKELSEDIWSAAKMAGYGNNFINQEKYSLIDDHLPFLNRGIPAALIIDFEYPFWHTNRDDLENVSSDSLKIVGEVLLKWLEPGN